MAVDQEVRHHLLPEPEEGFNGSHRVRRQGSTSSRPPGGHRSHRAIEPSDSFTATSKDKTLVTLPVTAAQFGSGDVAELVLDVDRTFVPGGSDTRELGIQVFHTFVEPK